MGPHTGTNRTLGLHRRVGGLWRKEGLEDTRVQTLFSPSLLNLTFIWGQAFVKNLPGAFWSRAPTALVSLESPACWVGCPQFCPLHSGPALRTAPHPHHVCAQVQAVPAPTDQLCLGIQRMGESVCPELD